MGETVEVIQIAIVSLDLKDKKNTCVRTSSILPVTGEGLPSSWPGHAPVLWFPPIPHAQELSVFDYSFSHMYFNTSPLPFFRNDQDFPIKNKTTKPKPLTAPHFPQLPLHFCASPNMQTFHKCCIFLLAPFPHLLTPHLSPLLLGSWPLTAPEQLSLMLPVDFPDPVFTSRGFWKAFNTIDHSLCLGHTIFVFWFSSCILGQSSISLVVLSSSTSLLRVGFPKAGSKVLSSSHCVISP